MKFLTLLVPLLLALPALAQDPLPLTQQTPPHTRIQMMSDQLDKLASASLVSFPLIAELNRPLDDAVVALQKADPDGAIQRLDVFNQKLGAQTAASVGDPLLLQSKDIQNQISELVSDVTYSDSTSCNPPDAGAYVVLTVGPGRDFSSIRDALQYADSASIAAVELQLAPQSFNEGLLAIDRHTRLTAPEGEASVRGRIVNNGPYTLELNNIVVANSMGSGISVEHPCATTVLSHVEVQRTNGTAVEQKSGFFTATDVTVAFANAPAFPTPDQGDVGRGLHLSGGVRACATGIHSVGNDAGALLVEGEDTQVYVTGLESRLDRINPWVLEQLVNSREIVPGSGMVEARDHALLLAQLVRVTSGEAYGFLLDTEARAHLRYAHVDATDDFRVSSSRTVGGFNVVSRSGTFELTGALSEQGGAGLFVNASHSAFASVDSRFERNDIGWAARADTAEELSCLVSRCFIRTTFLRNVRTSDANWIPTPDPEGCPACPTVEFAPTWCR